MSCPTDARSLARPPWPSSGILGARNAGGCDGMAGQETRRPPSRAGLRLRRCLDEPASCGHLRRHPSQQHLLLERSESPRPISWAQSGLSRLQKTAQALCAMRSRYLSAPMASKAVMTASRRSRPCWECLAYGRCLASCAPAFCLWAKPYPKQFHLLPCGLTAWVLAGPGAVTGPRPGPVGAPAASDPRGGLPAASYGGGHLSWVSEVFVVTT